MKVRVSLIGVGPAERAAGSVDETVELADGATVGDLLRRLDLPPDDPLAVLVDGAAVPAVERDGRPLDEGAAVTVFPAIKGGARPHVARRRA